MRKVTLVFMILSTILIASTTTNKKARLDKHIKQQLEKEKKYAKEQVFYSEENYDFSGAEVNPESLKNIDNIEPQDDFDMDHVYD